MNSIFYLSSIPNFSDFDEVNKLKEKQKNNVYKNDELIILCRKIAVLRQKWIQSLQEKPSALPCSYIFSGNKINSCYDDIVVTFRIHLKIGNTCEYIGMVDNISKADINQLKDFDKILQIEINFSIKGTPKELIILAVNEFCKLPFIPPTVKQYFTSSQFSPSRYILKFKDLNEFLAKEVALLRYKTLHSLLLRTNIISLEILLNPNKKIDLNLPEDFYQNIYTITSNLLNNEPNYAKNLAILQNKLFFFNSLCGKIVKKITAKAEDSSALEITLNSTSGRGTTNNSNSSSLNDLPDGFFSKTIREEIDLMETSSYLNKKSDSSYPQKTMDEIEKIYGKKFRVNLINFTENAREILFCMRYYVTPVFFKHFFNLVLVCIRKKKIELKISVESLYNEVYSMVGTYSKNMNLDERILLRKLAFYKQPSTVCTEIVDSTNLNLTVSMVHNMQSNWEGKYSYFSVKAGLYYCCQFIDIYTQTQLKKITKFYQPFVDFSEKINFFISIKQLRKDMGLYFTLYGHSDERSKGEEIGFAHTLIFDFNNNLLDGTLLLGLVPLDLFEKQRAICWFQRFSKLSSSRPYISIVLNRYSNAAYNGICGHGNPYKYTFEYTNYLRSENLLKYDNLEDFVKIIQSRVQRRQFNKLTIEENFLIWKNKEQLAEFSSEYGLVPAIIYSGIFGNCSDEEIDKFLAIAKNISIEDNLILLGPNFSKESVRRFALKNISILSSDQFIELCPVLISCLAYESNYWSLLLCITLQRSWDRPQIAHIIFWNSKYLQDDPYAGEQYVILMACLLASLDSRHLQHISHQLLMINFLKDVALRIQQTNELDKKEHLLKESVRLLNLITEKKTVLPVNYSFYVSKIMVKECKVFSSASSPFLISFLNGKICGSNIKVIFKVGDQLKRDMITIEIFRLMNRLWLEEGLDLKMITYDVSPVGKFEGFIQVVNDVVTLGEIHASYGLTGSFKNECIITWLKAKNVNIKEYKRAVNNFLLSSAAYCVATYILGICDRHNDNILISRSGHLLHIDFNKYMGDAQTFLGFKRDRVPFVLTPDMVAVINQYNDNDGSGFQHFIDTCLLAYKIVRKNFNIIISSINLLVSSDFVATETVDYVFETLKLDLSEHEAHLAFNKLIDKSISNKFTQINFMVHNLSQQKKLIFKSAPSFETTFMFPFCDTLMILTPENHGYIERINTFDHLIKMNLDNIITSFIGHKVKLNINKYEYVVYRSMDEIFDLSTKLEGKHGKRTPLVSSFVSSAFIDNLDFQKKHFGFMYQCLDQYYQLLLEMNIGTSEILLTFFHKWSRDIKMCSENRNKISSLQSLSDIEDERTPQIKISFNLSQDVFSLLIMHGKNLQMLPMKSNGDIYIQINVYPSNQIKKSKSFPFSSSPTFMFQFQFSYTTEIKNKKELEIFINHKVFSKKSKIIGSLKIDLVTVLSNISNSDHGKWYNLSEQF